MLRIFQFLKSKASKLAISQRLMENSDILVLNLMLAKRHTTRFIQALKDGLHTPGRAIRIS